MAIGPSLSVANTLLAPTLQQSSGTPIWVLLLILLLLVLLLWWGLTRNNVRESQPSMVEESHGHEESHVIEEAHVEHVIPEAELIAERSPDRPVEPIVPDDLKKIEGIGPKVSQLLNDNGVVSFAQLAAFDPGNLKRIIQDEAGYKMIDPTSWPQQAQLAADGDWGALEKLQDELTAGRSKG